MSTEHAYALVRHVTLELDNQAKAAPELRQELLRICPELDKLVDFCRNRAACL